MPGYRPIQAQPVTILVVDDYEPWRRWVCSVLNTQEQLQVLGEVSDGLEAVRQTEVLRPDILLLDIGLPNLNGIEVASQISQTAHNVRTVFLTAETNAEVVIAALTNGALGYIAKVDAGTELLPAIESILRGERFLSKRIKELDLETS